MAAGEGEGEVIMVRTRTVLTQGVRDKNIRTAVTRRCRFYAGVQPVLVTLVKGEEGGGRGKGGERGG